MNKSTHTPTQHNIIVFKLYVRHAQSQQDVGHRLKTK